MDQYAEDERFPCSDPEAAKEIFHMHHVFLMMCFLTRAQSIGWSNTPIYQTFKRQFPVSQLEVSSMTHLTPRTEGLRRLQSARRGSLYPDTAREADANIETIARSHPTSLRSAKDKARAWEECSREVR